MGAEGWYVDPFGRHDARWFSDGTPTALVRDGDTVLNDNPPSPAFDGQLEHLEGTTAEHGDDLRRADDNDTPFDPAAGPRKAFDVFDQTAPGVYWHPRSHRRDGR